MRNSETVKILFLSQGLEELRGVFHYQLMQSQLLTVGVQINQQMLDTYQRAYAEIDLLLGPNPLLTPSRYINPKYIYIYNNIYIEAILTQICY